MNSITLHWLWFWLTFGAFAYPMYLWFQLRPGNGNQRGDEPRPSQPAGGGDFRAVLSWSDARPTSVETSKPNEVRDGSTNRATPTAVEREGGMPHTSPCAEAPTTSIGKSK